MYVLWQNNGNSRVFDMQQRRALSKLKKAVKKHVSDPTIRENISRAQRLADVHWSIYSLIGNSEFESFKISFEKEGWDL